MKKKKEPLILCLTNTVAENFTANCLLAIGAKPVMVSEKSEAAYLAEKADAILVNLGTVNEHQAEVMRAAISVANACGTPWVLDPVGCQLLPYRGKLAAEFIALRPTAIRGNHDEIDYLGKTDIPTLSTGEVDKIIIPDALNTQHSVLSTTIPGGVPMLQMVTATGCAQGAICAALLAQGQAAVEALESASRMMKRAGELAWKKTKTPGSFQIAIIDALWEMKNEG